MSSEDKEYFTKDNLDRYLKELAREYRKLNGTAVPAEIILIGGAAILVNYDFRDMTTDVEAVIRASSAMKDAINRIGDRYDLPHGWLNADFMSTSSYSSRLDEFSVYYKTFSSVLQVRTIAAEYLIAMKLRSSREYKNDLSDIIGILAEHEKRKTPITLDNIIAAVNNLYGNWADIPADSKAFIQDTLRDGNYEQIFSSISEAEKKSKEILVAFENNYTGVTTESNANSILRTLKVKKIKP